MKKPMSLMTCAIILFSAFYVQAQDDIQATGYDGDHFSLEAALSIFKSSSTMDEFEQKLNDPETKVNNLDLNGDGEVDYIKVIDQSTGSAHAIILQVPVSKTENQDIAVIEIEKNEENVASLQIIGDEDVYGEENIVEPYDDMVYEETSSQGYDEAPVIVNVYSWPLIRTIYSPHYVVWNSPYRWAYYPPSWRPWRPYPYASYHTHVIGFHVGFRTAPVRRLHVAHTLYVPHRKTSTVVVKRTTTTRTVRKTNHGNVVGTKKTTVTKSPSHNKASKTTTKTVKTKKGVATKKTTRERGTKVKKKH